MRSRGFCLLRVSFLEPPVPAGAQAGGPTPSAGTGARTVCAILNLTGRAAGEGRFALRPLFKRRPRLQPTFGVRHPDYRDCLKDGHRVRYARRRRAGSPGLCWACERPIAKNPNRRGLNRLLPGALPDGTAPRVSRRLRAWGYACAPTRALGPPSAGNRTIRCNCSARNLGERSAGTDADIQTVPGSTACAWLWAMTVDLSELRTRADPS